MFKKFVLACFSLALITGCAKDSSTNPPQKMEDAIVVSGEQEPAGTVTIKKSLLGKDLIFGGYITNFESELDRINAAGLIGQFLSTRLIQLEIQEGDEPTLSFNRSEKRPWIGSETGKSMTSRLANVKIASQTADAIVISREELGKGLEAVMEVEGYDGSVTTRVLPNLKVAENTFVIPIEQRWNIKMEKEMWRLGVEITYFMKLREENPKFEKRTADANLGFFTLEDMYRQADFSYARQVHNRPETTILRWDLNKTVTYVLGKNTPERFRPLIKDGIETWNKVLSDATGVTKKYIEVVDETKERPAVLGDPNVNVIYWEADESKGAGMMYASWSNDPLTGEIFNTHVYIGGQQLVKGLEELYDYNIGVNPHAPKTGKTINLQNLLAAPKGESFTVQDKINAFENLTSEKKITLSLGSQKFIQICNRAQNDSPADLLGEKPKLSKDDYVNAWIKEAVLHEVGHNLGLRHNFKGSLGYVSGKTDTNSIMDYNTEAMYLRGDSKSIPGAYDIQAINYGYAGKKPAKGQELPFCTDENTLPYQGILNYDAKCARFDEGPQPLQKELKLLRTSYILLNTESDQFEREWRIQSFIQKVAMTTIEFGSSPLVSKTDKQLMSDSIADLLNMTKFKMSNGQTINFSERNPYYSFVRALAATSFVFYAADWVLNEGATISPKMTDTLADILSERSQTNSFAQIETLMDIIVKVGSQTASSSNQAQLWQTLSKTEASVDQQMTSQSEGFKKQMLVRLKELVLDRKKALIGKLKSKE